MLLRLFLLGWFVLSTGQAATVLPWQPVDLELTAERSHDWWEFPVVAAFSHAGDPAGAALQVEGFWNGGNQWIVRAVFPKPGAWTWETASADPGLDGAGGSFEVVAATPSQVADNPNLRGQLKIAPDNRHFVYADGTPVFLLASTLWAANTARCGLGENESGPFYQHLADRKTKGFNTLLMQYLHGYGDYSDSPGHRNEGGKRYDPRT